ncbi:MarR family winged helix-turn-helix transcriptional regulator [Paenibacillus cellulositrophicus]|uniref:MarR family transcriptional regulator n=3 Tax=Paenibacillus TaxID=44249 RepID=A0A1R1EP17_9BACL|nr:MULTISPECIES: MarR family transcriptional regulator [Paenibacillus]MBJ9988589.1 MarR family transcriptional regulator [Paenibacillus sp. S28]MCM2999241.1 MarR family transcriptional regulator [Paenibacillus cellulositrophicus]MEC0178489.1 MarR family transcriptional regulator [Paenibacillus favisporus]OMF53540.1 MarR family transcriptional regulator [Paenibacillus rhizosphaerae]OXL84574.1 transcriptional regulator [Paenibacillus sp. SSG-1]
MQTSEFAKMWSKLSKDYKLHMENELAPALTESQLTVLEVLSDQERMKPSDLTPLLATSPAAVTMLLDRMEKNGLIQRERDLNDRRIVWVSISEKGKNEVLRGLQIRDAFLSGVLSRISLHNQQLLVYLLGKITA